MNPAAPSDIPRRGLRLLVVLACSSLWLAWSCRPVPVSPPAEPALATSEGEIAPAAWGDGFVVWESNRSGVFRIYRRDFRSGDVRPLSPEEPGRDHCCAHLSPDGSRLLYLSLPGGTSSYLPPDTPGELRVRRLADGFEWVLATAARHYGEHAAAVWWSETVVQYIDERGRSVVADLARGTRRVVATGPVDGEGYLVDPTGRWATANTPSFSRLTPEGAILRGTPRGGCQPYFDRDGVLGYWTAGAGGPIDAIELESGETFTILAKGDPALPAEQSYLYFPRLSRDRSLLAVGASDGSHDHFRSNYDIFLVELDPETLRPSRPAVRITSHSAVDRFPDVYRPGPERRSMPPPRPSRRSETVVDHSVWPGVLADLAWAWELAERPNRVRPDAASDILEPEGRAAFDRLGRLALGGGSFYSDEGLGNRIVRDLKATNTVTIQLVVEAPSVAASGPILTLSLHPGRRSFRIDAHEGRARIFLRTAETLPSGDPPLELGILPELQPIHLAASFSPGRFRAYRDGALAVEQVHPGDFFHWKDAWLLVGAEAGSPERFRGFVSHLSLHARELDAAAIAESASLSLRALAETRRADFTVVEARLLSRSRIPELAEISPYRSALATEEWEVLRHLGGRPVTGRVRVARWVWLGGERAAESREEPLRTVKILRLEPYSIQRQLQSLVVSDTLPPPGQLSFPLAFDVGWITGP